MVLIFCFHYMYVYLDTKIYVTEIPSYRRLKQLWTINPVNFIFKLLCIIWCMEILSLKTLICQSLSIYVNPISICAAKSFLKLHKIILCITHTIPIFVLRKQFGWHEWQVSTIWQSCQGKRWIDLLKYYSHKNILFSNIINNKSITIPITYLTACRSVFKNNE